ncbi:MAG: FHA domain-containing protein [Planctomycetota bacterium]|nr:FHA domain-containing protein [Planctomycetota bacterium]MCX8003951.1 FHA domain-containing protein [Burkholderiaceae bacterium]MDW8373879.1 FHA domain-containing protein [Planctomycetota bacterium]
MKRRTQPEHPQPERHDSPAPASYRCPRPSCERTYAADSQEARDGFCSCGTRLEAVAEAPTLSSQAASAASGRIFQSVRAPQPLRRAGNGFGGPPLPPAACAPPSPTPPAASPAASPAKPEAVDGVPVLVIVGPDGRDALRLPLVQDEVLIGRSSRHGVPDIDCTPWADLGISRRHCLVFRAPQGWMLRRLPESAPVFHQGRELAPGESVPLRPNDEVVLGSGLGLTLEERSA